MSNSLKLDLFRISYNIFRLCHYNCTIISNVNSNIIYNDESNVLLTINLGMLSIEIKQIICYRLEWNYNNIEVDITLRCQLRKHHYYHVLIVYDDNFKIMMDFFCLWNF
jgi:hypothetical protein